MCINGVVLVLMSATFWVQVQNGLKKVTSHFLVLSWIPQKIWNAMMRLINSKEQNKNGCSTYLCLPFSMTCREPVCTFGNDKDISDISCRPKSNFFFFLKILKIIKNGLMILDGLNFFLFFRFSNMTWKWLRRLHSL